MTKLPFPFFPASDAVIYMDCGEPVSILTAQSHKKMEKGC
jgi:hypothetical protein